jgi:hypothetical protein
MRGLGVDSQPAPLGKFLDVGIATRPAAQAGLAEAAERGAKISPEALSRTSRVPPPAGLRNWPSVNMASRHCSAFRPAATPPSSGSRGHSVFPP